ncbi:MAG TPA: rRNA maturation RNase YbeY [Stenotrophobium sp.]|jgi:probable rRNA maturation factor|nr:rRNA maturation RNase YbeY [Stenotrophobium sp.]
MNEVTVQRAVTAAGIPAASSLRHWARAALEKSGGIVIRIVDEAESRELNCRYRQKDRPTNVLSFAYDQDDTLGDLVICAPVVAREAQEQHKQSRAHWAHMVVHGCLHLQGHDHEQDAQAAAMEALEIRILEQLGFDNPYLEK